MNLYLDASAIVKRYLHEAGSMEVREAIDSAEVAGSSIISRAEVMAALAKAVRMGIISHDDGRTARNEYHSDQTSYFDFDVTLRVVTDAEQAAWRHNLRGYDAVQLSSAFNWKREQDQDVYFGTFDLRLWKAAGNYPLVPWPDDLPALLESWQLPSN